jgi:competence protein ComGC
MKLGSSNQRTNALTLTEVLVVVFVIAVLIALAFSKIDSSRRDARKFACIYNLKVTALAFRVWPSGQSDENPMQVSVERGGAKELVTTGNVASVFQVMSNELGTPKLLICPADASRHWATNFTTDFGNNSISYFVGLDASEDDPYSILMGDDNFEIGGVPVKSGVLLLSTNTPIGWTGERHRFAGNIALADGSIQMLTTSGLTNTMIKQYEYPGDFTNRFRIAIP